MAWWRRVRWHFVTVIETLTKTNNFTFDILSVTLDLHTFCIYLYIKDPLKYLGWKVVTNGRSLQSWLSCSLLLFKPIWSCTHRPSQTRFHGESLLHLTYQPASMTNTLALPFQSLLGHNWVFEIVVLWMMVCFSIFQIGLLILDMLPNCWVLNHLIYINVIYKWYTWSTFLYYNIL